MNENAGSRFSGSEGGTWEGAKRNIHQKLRQHHQPPHFVKGRIPHTATESNRFCIVGILLKNKFVDMAAMQPDTEVNMEIVGKTLMGADKYQCVLPFEFISVFLLACIIGGLVILNHKKEEK